MGWILPHVFLTHDLRFLWLLLELLYIAFYTNVFYCLDMRNQPKASEQQSK